MPAEDANKKPIDYLETALMDMDIIGEPIDIGDRVIIPIAKIGMAFGAYADSRFEDTARGGFAGGAGGGVGISPSAVLIASEVISGPEGIEVFFLDPPSPLAGPLSDIAAKILEMSKVNFTDCEKVRTNTASNGT